MRERVGWRPVGRLAEQPARHRPARLTRTDEGEPLPGLGRWQQTDAASSTAAGGPDIPVGRRLVPGMLGQREQAGRVGWRWPVRLRLGWSTSAGGALAQPWPQDRGDQHDREHQPGHHPPGAARRAGQGQRHHRRGRRERHEQPHPEAVGQVRAWSPVRDRPGRGARGSAAPCPRRRCVNRASARASGRRACAIARASGDPTAVGDRAAPCRRTWRDTMRAASRPRRSRTSRWRRDNRGSARLSSTSPPRPTAISCPSGMRRDPPRVGSVDDGHVVTGQAAHPVMLPG